MGASYSDVATDDAREDELKIILLGGPECGKSTIAKQLIRISDQDFFSEHREQYKIAIHQSAVRSMQVLIRATEHYKRFEILFENWGASQRVLEIRPSQLTALTKVLIEDLQSLWADPAILSTFVEHAEDLQILESARFLTDFDRVSSINYLPTDEDILYAYTPTAHYTSYNLIVRRSLLPSLSGNLPVQLFDVGGSRAQKDQWADCFPNTSVVIFCASLSEYNHNIVEEDKAVNRTHNSLALFKEVCEWFANIPVLLVFTKHDTFLKKLGVHDLSVCFPDWHSGKDVEEALQFFVKKYLAQCPSRPAHLTQALRASKSPWHSGRSKSGVSGNDNTSHSGGDSSVTNVELRTNTFNTSRSMV